MVRKEERSALVGGVAGHGGLFTATNAISPTTSASPGRVTVCVRATSFSAHQVPPGSIQEEQGLLCPLPRPQLHGDEKSIEQRLEGSLQGSRGCTGAICKAIALCGAFATHLKLATVHSHAFYLRPCPLTCFLLTSHPTTSHPHPTTLASLLRPSAVSMMR